MKRLLSIELQKLWLNRASRVLIISYFVILSFIALISSIEFNVFGIQFRLADQGIFNFPYIWHITTYAALFLKLFLALVIVSMMSNEYTYGTLKQNLIDGLSKREFLLSKVSVVLLFSAASTLFMFIMILILGYTNSAFTETSIVFTDMQYLFAYFLDLFAFFSFCLFAGVLIKRSAFAIGFVFIWYIIEWLAMPALWILGVKEYEDRQRVRDFLPLESISDLIVEPVTRFKAYKAIEGQVAGAVEVRDYSVHAETILIVTIWTAIFLYFSYYILKKRDL